MFCPMFVPILLKGWLEEVGEGPIHRASWVGGEDFWEKSKKGLESRSRQGDVMFRQAQPAYGPLPLSEVKGSQEGLFRLRVSSAPLLSATVFLK